MTTVLASQVTEVQAHHFMAEASELGWKPGFLPYYVQTDLGNGLELVLAEVNYEAGYFTYDQSAGCVTLRVFND